MKSRQIEIGIEIDCFLKTGFCRIKLLVAQVYQAEGVVGVGIAGIQRHSPMVRLETGGNFRVSILGVAEIQVIETANGDAGMGRRKIRVNLDGALEILLGAFGFVFSGVLVPVPDKAHAALIKIPGVKITRKLGFGPLSFGFGQFRSQGADHGFSDVVLHGENVFQVAVIAVRPKILARLSFDQLRCDAHPLAGAAHTALQHIAHIQFAGHLADIRGLAPVGEG